MYYGRVFTKNVLDRNNFPDLNDREWDLVCFEVEGRIDNFIEEKIDSIVRDVVGDMYESVDQDN